ncbi:MAG: leucyl/phenylalanyl-tRNA--protein transferase [Brooklawnia sp.]|jgi:leucyl/phenylalanyl-tRNA--protein transferase
MIMQVFGPPELWPEQDLIAFSDEFDLSMTLAAYCSGAFPMPLHGASFDSAMGWWSPVNRAVLELDDLRVRRSLAKSARRYTTTIDQAFDQVLANCADPDRPGGWIDDQIMRIYTEGHRMGVVHSVETWDAAGRLVGGLYGVSLWGLFAGESMFHDPVHGRDASKVALGRLVNELRARPDGTALLDMQWQTDHLTSLGASEISRSDYLERLAVALSAPQTVWARTRRPGDWRLVLTA